MHSTVTVFCLYHPHTIKQLFGNNVSVIFIKSQNEKIITQDIHDGRLLGEEFAGKMLLHLCVAFVSYPRI